MSERRYQDAKLYASRAPWSQRVELRLITMSDNGQRHIGTNMVMEPLEDAGFDPPATVALSYEAAQHLIDQLWDCGLRPSEGSGSAGAMAATQKHLEDMRRLVFVEKGMTP